MLYNSDYPSLLFSTIKNNHSINVNGISLEGSYSCGEPGVSSVRFLWIRHIYIHFFKERKVTPHPTFKAVRGFQKELRGCLFTSEGSRVLKIFGALQWIRNINRIPLTASLNENWSAYNARKKGPRRLHSHYSIATWRYYTEGGQGKHELLYILVLLSFLAPFSHAFLAPESNLFSKQI